MNFEDCFETYGSCFVTVLGQGTTCFLFLIVSTRGIVKNFGFEVRGLEHHRDSQICDFRRKHE
jgi:hypothetical protein